ncbi:MAG: HAMP domain-containing protein [Magnetococcales bacterium]|nr:HAMP domain-containing protein [Magnetococcales bacterium]
MIARWLSNRWVLGGLLILVVVIAIITGQGLHGSAVAGGDYSLVFLVLLYVNLVLAFGLAVLVIRQLSRLWLERRQRLAGAVLRSRMVFLFVALSLVPTLVIAVLSLELLNQGVDSWFSDRITKALEQSLKLARSFYRETQRTTRHDAEDISRNRLITSALTLQFPEEALAALEKERLSRGLDEIAIFHEDGTRIATAGELPMDPIPDLTTLEDGSTKAILFVNDQGNRVRAIVKIGTDLFLSTGRSIDLQALTQMEGVEAAYKDYLHLRTAHGVLKDSHTVFLALISLLLVLAAIWSGFRIADTITNPIIELVIGTRKVASGDLSVALSVTGDDELATLMAAFNAMTLKLMENRNELQSNYALLEERRRFMEAIVRNISSGVISVNRMDEITLMNPAAGRLLSLDVISAHGRHYAEIIPSSVQDELAPVLAQSLEQRPRASEYSAGGDAALQIRFQGSEKPLILLARVTFLHDDEGARQGFIITMDDLTDVINAQRSTAWSDVARRIAHEIKNPLTPIQLWAQRIRRKHILPPDQERRNLKILDEGTNVIINQVEELRTLVNEFSTFARLPRPNLKRDDINEAIREVLALHHAELKPLKVRSDLYPTLPRIPMIEHRSNRS